nr:MAG TPA: hypothetical protein [Caudoviricetes sp.]
MLGFHQHPTLLAYSQMYFSFDMRSIIVTLSSKRLSTVFPKQVHR